MTREPQAVIARVSVAPRHWIHGDRVTSNETFTDISPIDGRVLGEISRGTAMEAAAAVAAAKAAVPGWAAPSHTERARILHAIADGAEKRIENLAIVETTGNGALLIEGLGRLTNRIVTGPTLIRNDVGAQATEPEGVLSIALCRDWEFRCIRRPRR